MNKYFVIDRNYIQKIIFCQARQWATKIKTSECVKQQLTNNRIAKYTISWGIFVAVTADRRCYERFERFSLMQYGGDMRVISCPNCGELLSNDAEYCSLCGEMWEQPETFETNATQPFAIAHTNWHKEVDAGPRRAFSASGAATMPASTSMLAMLRTP